MGVEVSLGLPRRSSGVNRGLVLERKSSVVQIVYRKNSVYAVVTTGELKPGSRKGGR